MNAKVKMPVKGKADVVLATTVAKAKTLARARAAAATEVSAIAFKSKETTRTGLWLVLASW